MFRFPRACRGNGKTVMTTQHMMGVIYSRDFLDRLKRGESLSEEDYISGLKETYVQVGKFFYGNDEECE